MEASRIEDAIKELEGFPLSEDAQHLVNYLRANQDDVERALAD